MTTGKSKQNSEMRDFDTLSRVNDFILFTLIYQTTPLTLGN